MNNISINPDEIVYWQSGFVKLNATIVGTWIVMSVLVLVSWIVTRRLSTDTAIPKLQNALEVIVDTIRHQIHDVGQQDPTPYVPFVGTLFLFIAMANLLNLIPGYQTPTGSLSTTASLAVCVLFAVPVFGISRRGVGKYLKQYVQPTLIMFPFNVIGELSRTLALAVRLYGNMMSGTVIAAVLLAFVPLFVPVLMQLLGLLTGMIQAYIFAILAMVYIASATRIQTPKEPSDG